MGSRGGAPLPEAAIERPYRKESWDETGAIPARGGGVKAKRSIPTSIGSLMSLHTLAALIRATALAAACGIVPLPVLALAADGAAPFAMAVRYEHAEGVPRDYSHALELYCVAASQGHADASFSIAWIYLNGRGVARDDTNGAAWLRGGADRGHLLAGRLVAPL